MSPAKVSVSAVSSPNPGRLAGTASRSPRRAPNIMYTAYTLRTGYSSPYTCHRHPPCLATRPRASLYPFSSYNFPSTPTATIRRAPASASTLSSCPRPERFPSRSAATRRPRTYPPHLRRQHREQCRLPRFGASSNRCLKVETVLRCSHDPQFVDHHDEQHGPPQEHRLWPQAKLKNDIGLIYALFDSAHFTAAATP